MIYISKDSVSEVYIQRNGNCSGNCCDDLKVKCEPNLQTKNISVTENGSYIISPDDGYSLSQASVDVNVPDKYRDGYNDGLKYGEDKGKDEGFKEGYNSGKEDGLKEGEEKGKEEGLKEGEAKGRTEGIEQGKAEQKSLLTELSVERNGTYQSENGYSKVDVNVPEREVKTQKKEYNIKDNRTVTVKPDSGYDGLSEVKVSVNVECDGCDVIEKTITKNGDYNAYEDDVDGYSKVTVDVRPNLQSKSVSVKNNGSLTINPDSNYDGLSAVKLNVDVEGIEFSTKEITIKNNGVYEASKEYVDGYSKVIVDVEQGGTGKDIFTRFVTSSQDGLTSITTDMFDESIDIKLRDYSFSNMDNLESVEIRGEWGVPKMLCANDKSLKNVTITGNLDKGIIWESAFENCPSIQSISIPAVTTINKGAFYGSFNDIDINLTGVMEIKQDAFRNTKINEITISSLNNSYIDLYKDAFTSSKVKKINFSDRTNRVFLRGDNVFAGCDSLEKIGNEDTVFELFEHGYEFSGISGTVSLHKRQTKFIFAGEAGVQSLGAITIETIEWVNGMYRPTKWNTKMFNKEKPIYGNVYGGRIDYKCDDLLEIVDTDGAKTFWGLKDTGEVHLKQGRNDVESLLKQYKPFDNWSFIYDI